MSRRGTPSKFELEKEFDRQAGRHAQFVAAVVKQLPRPRDMRSAQSLVRKGWDENQLELKRRLATLTTGPRLTQVAWGIELPAIDGFKVSERFVRAGSQEQYSETAITIKASEYFWEQFTEHEERRTWSPFPKTKVEVNFADSPSTLAQDWLTSLDVHQDLGGKEWAQLHLSQVWTFLKTMTPVQQRGWFDKKVPYGPSSWLFLVLSSKTGAVSEINFKFGEENDSGPLQIEARPIGGGLRFSHVGVISPDRFAE